MLSTCPDSPYTMTTDRPRVNIGDVLHLLEIAVLLMSIGVSYAKFTQAANAVEMHAAQLSRIEHYLSSKDPAYWRLSRESE